MNSIISAVLVVGIIGLLFGLLLALASIIFHVKVDERIEQIEEILPGANCGACGYAGCSAYATAIVNEDAPINACSVGKAPVAEKIGEVMGKSADTAAEMVACVKCQGTCEAAKDKYEYEGVADCRAAAKLAGGQKACTYGCLGFGNCVKACQFGAISIADGIAQIDEEKCTGCGKCKAACPKAIIELVSKDKQIMVLCNNKETGKLVNTVCTSGCIACKICEKNCPQGAITVIDNLAVIDYDKCTLCGTCTVKCPKKVIKMR